MKHETESPYAELTRGATFVLVLRQMLWIEEEANRRGTSKSELVRTIIDAAMAQSEKEAA